MGESWYCVGFSVFPGIGPKRFRELVTIFGTAENAWKASKDDLRDAGLGTSLVERFLSFRSSFSLSNYQNELEKEDVWVITLADSEYPEKLKVLDDPPFVLYGKGDKSCISFSPTVGIVGTRTVTSYGRQVTNLFTTAIVQAGCMTISGLALGVDAIVHKTTIELQGKTIAVLGSGVDQCYPRSHYRLYQSILTCGGAIISEYPLRFQPSKGSFPSRNRIIAALSDAVLVTEGSEDSGALITASVAMNIGRTVYAVPGPITSSFSKGPLKLLTTGALLAATPDEILRKLLHSNKSGKTYAVTGDTQDEQEILDLLLQESLSFDALSEKTGKDVGVLGILLTTLELKKKIMLAADGKYSIRRT